jgi:hypothetical protein
MWQWFWLLPKFLRDYWQKQSKGTRTRGAVDQEEAPSRREAFYHDE